MYSNTPTVGQSLSLNCLVTTVTGINSMITVTWTSCGETLPTAQGTSPLSCNIPQVTTDDQDKVYQCEVVINTSPPVTASRHITLSVNVPHPTVQVTAPNTQTVGQSLTLQCEVTTVRGITSRVDIVWSSDSTVLRRMDGVSSSVMGNSLVYTDSYTISQLSRYDNGRVYRCTAMITYPQTTASSSITLYVNDPPITAQVTTSSTQLVGQPLVLKCSMTTVRDIVSRVDIVWATESAEIQRRNGVTALIMSNSAMYNNSYIITELTTDHHGKMYRCKVELNTSPSSITTTESFLPYVTVPPPTVSVTNLSPQEVGHSLMLQCNVTTVRGIKSRVDVVWSSNNTIINRTNSIIPNMKSTSQVYTDSYTIAQLNTEDDGRAYRCEVVIHSSPSITATGDIVLDVVVPFLTINVKAFNDEATVDQPLTMECNVTTTRGVNSRVDVVWSVNGTELERIEAVDVNYTTSFSTVYTHFYTLNMTEPGRAYQCEAIININPPVKATGSIVTLDVAGLQDDQDVNSIFTILFILSAGGNMLILVIIVIIIIFRKRLMNRVRKSGHGYDMPNDLSTEIFSSTRKKSSPTEKASPTSPNRSPSKCTVDEYQDEVVFGIISHDPPKPTENARKMEEPAPNRTNNKFQDKVALSAKKHNPTKPIEPVKDDVKIQDNPAYGVIS